MKAVARALLFGAATASYLPEQIPLELPKQVSSSWQKPLKQLTDSMKHLTGEARRAWDEVAMLFPESSTRLPSSLPRSPTSASMTASGTMS